MEIERDKIPFNEAWYLRQYPDVTDAIVTGVVPDAWTHYVRIGRDENRHICPFDEHWYLEKYPDLAKSIEAKTISSAHKHYIRHGFLEGRQPLPAGRAKRIFTYGAFGTNNVGDEAILEGIKRLYPDCIQIYHHKCRVGEGVRPHQILDRPDFFQRDDYLILGGGGLLYDRATVLLMTNLAKAALTAGAVVDIARLGCEAAHTEYATEIIELFSLARRVSVRSTESQRIIREITGKTYSVEFDFAFNLAPEVQAIPRNLCDMPTVGVVTATSSIDDIRALAAALRPFTRIGAKQLIRFLYIPHSHSYFDSRNNDLVTGELIWSLMNMHEAASEDLFQVVEYDPEPLSVLKLYRRLDGVLSSRYHGLIFGKIAQVPTVALGGGLIKLRSFIKDHSDADMVVAQDMGELVAKAGPFFNSLVTRRANQTFN